MSIEILGHSTVYEKDGVYASHPANHGAWVSPDGDLLVGFLTGFYDRHSPYYHPVLEPYTKLQARSTNYGRSWTVETPNVDFEGTFSLPGTCQVSDNTIFRVCGVYDTGGEYCAEGGAFYASEDFGRVWSGPFAFVGLEDVFSDGWENTSRTRVDFPYFYLTRRVAGSFGTDECFRARMTKSGKFLFVDWVCRDDGRAAMPAVAWPYVALRMRTGPCRIELFKFYDGVWTRGEVVAETGRHNGNPPALAWISDNLVCAYGDRSKQMLFVAVKGQDGWEPTPIREGENPDIGYPQLLVLPDGTGACIYYWADETLGCTRIECTRFAVAVEGN
jgi:hypothetical protein